MTLTVEDGTGLPNADSYVSVADCTTYCANLGYASWASGAQPDQETALRRATGYIDPQYRSRFPGYQAKGPFYQSPTYPGQSLEWPRIGAYVVLPDNGRSDAFYYGDRRDWTYLNGIYYILPNVVPKQIINATCEAAVRELANPGCLWPDQTRDDLVTEFKIGPLDIKYDPINSPQNTVYQKIDAIMLSLLMQQNSNSGRVTR